MFEGFSSGALSEVLSSRDIGCVVTSQETHRQVQPLLQSRLSLGSLVLDSGLISSVADLDTREINPLFAIYVGGQSSLIAGEEKSYYDHLMTFFIQGRETSRASIW